MLLGGQERTQGRCGKVLLFYFTFSFCLFCQSSTVGKKRGKQTRQHTKPKQGELKKKKKKYGGNKNV